MTGTDSRERRPAARPARRGQPHQPARGLQDPSKLVNEVVALLRDRANKKGLELTACISKDMPRNVIGDPTRIRQVITNIAGNAIKFTETGGVTIELEPESPIPNEQGTITLVVRVIDTGPGIPEEQLKTIFHPYVSGSKGGTGLGLPTARRIIEEHGGTLQAHSDLGKGSDFVITLMK